MPPETCRGSVDAWILDTGFAVGLRTPKKPDHIPPAIARPGPRQASPFSADYRHWPATEGRAAHEPWAIEECPFRTWLGWMLPG